MPRVTFGIFVRNGDQFIGRTLESLVAQDLEDIEIVVCDNVSDDSTPDICRGFAARDPRVRFIDNGTNIGQIENFNKCCREGRGDYHRWLGCDDWVEPSYASRCVTLLDAHPEAIAATTFQSFIDDDGREFYKEYTGPRIEGNDPATRLDRWLWLLLHEDLLAVDPLCSLFRRTALDRTPLLRFEPCMDLLLAARLSLLGSFVHVPECLAHRRKAVLPHRERHRRWNPEDPTAVRSSYWGMSRALRAICDEADLPSDQSRRCRAAIRRYLLTGQRRRAARTLRRLVRRVPGYTGLRARLRGDEGAPASSRWDRHERNGDAGAAACPAPSSGGDGA